MMAPTRSFVHEKRHVRIPVVVLILQWQHRDDDDER